MCRQNLAVWCYALLVLSSSSEPRRNFTTTSDDEQNNSTVRYNIRANVTTNHNDDAELIRYNLHENSTKNNDNEQYEFRVNSTSDDYENDDSVQDKFHAHSAKDHDGGNQMPMELRANSTKADDKNNSTSYELHGNLMQVEDTSNLTLYELSEKLYEDYNKKNIVPYEMCENSTCIPLCCPFGSRLIKKDCVAGNADYPFPDVYEYATNDLLESRPIGKRLDQIFPLTIHDPCKFDRYLLYPEKEPDDEYIFLVNGSLYLSHAKEFVESYCLAVSEEDKYQIAVCFDEDSDEIALTQQNGIPVGLIVSLPFLLATFVIYSILPELRNMHGCTLRGYVSSLFVAYTFLAIIQLTKQDIISASVCIAFGTAYNNTVNVAYISIRLISVYSRVNYFLSNNLNVKIIKTNK